MERLPNEGERVRSENWAQLEVAKLMFPEKDKREAFLAFIGNPSDPESLASRFRQVLDKHPELKERIDSGDETAISEVVQLLS